jgi:hypothetical protein
MVSRDDHSEVLVNLAVVSAVEMPYVMSKGGAVALKVIELRDGFEFESLKEVARCFCYLTSTLSPSQASSELGGRRNEFLDHCLFQ